MLATEPLVRQVVQGLVARVWLPAALDREDLRQAARVALWKAGAAPEPLARLVARRAVITALRDGGYVRRRRRESAVPEADLPPVSLSGAWSEGLEDRDLGVEQRTLLWALVAQLPERERVAVTLAAEGWTQVEIAARLGVSARTAVRLTEKGHERLRAWWWGEEA